MLKVMLCPTGTLAGKDGAVTANPVPLAVALLMLTVEEPRLFAVTVSVFVLPAVTLPKLRLVLPSDRLPGCGCVELLLPTLKPWHPTEMKNATNRSNTLVARVRVVVVECGQ
jgi:hypothetical protein